MINFFFLKKINNRILIAILIYSYISADTVQEFSESISYMVIKRNPQAQAWATDKMRVISWENFVIMGNRTEI